MRPFEVPLPSKLEGVSVGRQNTPLALPPIPSATPRDAPTHTSTALVVPTPPEKDILARHAPVRTADGNLVPGTAMEGTSSTMLSEARVAQKALTARDKQATLTARMRIVSRAKERSGDPLSHWPVHGGQGTSRSAANVSARPPLAVEMESFIKRELDMMRRNCPNADPLSKVSIAAESLACFSNHFPEYSGPLGLIKRLFDEAFEQAGILRKQKIALETENISFRDYHATHLDKLRAEAKATATLMLKKNGDLQAMLDAQRAQQTTLEIELNRLMLTLTDRNKLLEDTEARATLFEKSVMEMTDKGVAQHNKIHVLRRDNERLMHNIQALEQQLREAEFSAAVTGSVNTSSKARRGSGGIKRTKSTVAALQRSGYPTEPKSPRNGVGVVEEDDDVGGDDTLRESVFDLETKVKKLTRANVTLTQEKQALVTRIESLTANLEREKNEMTPRPPWPAVSEALPGFSFNDLSTSEEVLSDLVQYFKDELSDERREVERKALTVTVRNWMNEEDICESDLTGRHRFFVCKGTGLHVPIYLRAKGVVRNRRMKKGDVEKLLSKFWADRRLQLRIETNLNATPLPDYYREWLTALTGSEKGAVELAYNLNSVCEQYQHDPDCSMFLRIFRGELSEHTIYDQIEIINRLAETCELNDTSSKGSLSRFTLHRILAKFFPTKTRQDQLRLRFALMLSCKGSTMVDYKQLFSEDDDGNQSRFVELLRRQHVEEALAFTVEIEEALRECMKDDGNLHLNNARMAVKHIDPAMPNSRIEELMAFGCGMTVSELEAHGQYFTYPAEPFLERTRTGILLKRYSRRQPLEGEEDESEEEDWDDGEEDIVMAKSLPLDASVHPLEHGNAAAPPADGAEAKEVKQLAPDSFAASMKGPVKDAPKKVGASRKDDMSFLNAFRKHAPAATPQSSTLTPQDKAVLGALSAGLGGAKKQSPRQTSFSLE